MPAPAPTETPTPETTGTQTPPAADASATASARQPGEDAAAYVQRVFSETPQAVGAAVAAVMAEEPAALAALAALVGDNGTASPIAAGIIGGLVTAAGADPAAVSEQLSAAVLGNNALIAVFIGMAREASVQAFSEVVGEGLADAASRARAAGNVQLAAEIQTLSTGRDAPLPLSEAFLDNYTPTTEGAAADGAGVGGGGGDAGVGGDVAGGGDAGGGSGGGSSTLASTTFTTTQLAGTGAPSGRYSTTAGTTTGGADPSVASR